MVNLAVLRRTEGVFAHVRRLTFRPNTAFPHVFEAPFTPAVEVGWRLARADWDRGLATEAALVVLDYGFEQLGLDEIVSFTSTTNLRSQRVMEKLRMCHDPADDFDHPGLPKGHYLRRHVFYRIAFLV